MKTTMNTAPEVMAELMRKRGFEDYRPRYETRVKMTEAQFNEIMDEFFAGAGKALREAMAKYSDIDVHHYVYGEKEVVVTVGQIRTYSRIFLDAEIIEEEAEDVEEIEITEDMISDARTFNNCGFFTITIDGKAYAVRWDGHGEKEVETDCPYKEQIKKWLFEAA